MSHDLQGLLSAADVRAGHVMMYCTRYRFEQPSTQASNALTDNLLGAILQCTS
jgi:hypothetical protein